jgi:hypothetical protein
MSTSNRIDLTVDNGKYRLLMDHRGSVSVLRHGEAWVNLDSTPGIKMVIAMAGELEELRARLAALESGELEVLPQDLRTHLGDFQTACRIARDAAPEPEADQDDRSYWVHQLKVINQIGDQIRANGGEVNLSIESPRYYMLNGHTLGFVHPDNPGWFNVLAGSVRLGGRDWKNGPAVLSPSDTLTPATHADFDFFRVSPKGHLPEPKPTETSPEI